MFLCLYITSGVHFMKNLIPIIAGIVFPVFFTAGAYAQNDRQTTLALSILKNRHPDITPSRVLPLLTGLFAGDSDGEVWTRDFNCVKTTQETSLKQAVKAYAIATGNQSILFLVLSDKTILQGMEQALSRNIPACIPGVGGVQTTGHGLADT